MTVETYLDASPGVVRDAANRPRLLVYVAHPMIRFVPIRPARFPETWLDGEYLVGLRWRGLVPIGRQTVRISHPAPAEGQWLMLDDGGGTLIRRWRHLVSVAPEGRGSRYRDRVEVEAGRLTPFVADFARRFYAHRQGRWRGLIRAGMDPANIPAPGGGGG
ncbi:MAG: hypothetical protein ACK5IP_05805 [Paracoccus sp. (in: a-proteobacteria)]